MGEFRCCDICARDPVFSRVLFKKKKKLFICRGVLMQLFTETTNNRELHGQKIRKQQNVPTENGSEIQSIHTNIVH